MHSLPPERLSDGKIKCCFLDKLNTLKAKCKNKRKKKKNHLKPKLNEKEKQKSNVVFGLYGDDVYIPMIRQYAYAVTVSIAVAFLVQLFLVLFSLQLELICLYWCVSANAQDSVWPLLFFVYFFILRDCRLTLHSFYVVLLVD